MTDPNVIEAVQKLNRAVGLLSRRDPGDEGRAMRLTREIDALLAAAEKPAAAGAPCESWYEREGVRCQLSAGHPSPHRYEGATPGDVMTWPTPAPTPAAVPGMAFGEPDAAGMLMRLLRDRVGDMPRHEECLTFNGRPSLTPSDDGDWLKRSDVLAALDPNAHNAARLKGGE